jgi:endoglycosylceramidase
MQKKSRRIIPMLLVLLLAVGAVVGGLIATTGGGSKANTSAIVSGPIHADSGPFLTDSHGRVVFLRGVNAVYKRAPYELYADPGKNWNFTRQDAKRMAALGFNVVRLGIIWQGLEPGTLGPNNPEICTPGPPHDPHQYNAAIADAYLAKVATTVKILGEYHIYTLLDMHEDVYSSEFGGEGAPPWAVCTDNHRIRILPGRWSDTYNDPGLITAVHHFWTNDVVGDLQGEYIRVWKTVAQYFRNNQWVVGYDPINEPFTKTLMPGVPEVAARLECLYTGRANPGRNTFDGSVLVCPPADPKFGLIRTFHAVSPKKLVFFEPDIFSISGHPNDIGSMDLPGLVFNFHDYCGFRSGKTGNPTDLNACSAQELRTMQRRSEERPDIASAAQPQGPAWFMSEFGATTSNALMERLTANADNLMLGWTYWAWKYYSDPTGSSAEALVRPNGQLSATSQSLSRVYPQAVAGTPVSFTFDPETAEFHMLYVPNQNVTAPTVIFVPVSLHYRNGYDVTVVGGTVVSKANVTHLVITNDPGASSVSVTVKRVS